MNTIMVGFGDIAPRHLEVLQNKKCKVVGLITRNKKTALLKTQEFKIDYTYNTISEINPNLTDFFVVMVSPDQTPKVLEELIPLGKPILVEKPVSFGSKKLDSLINLQKKNGCPIMVGMNRRFYSIFQQGINYLKKKNLTIDAITVEAPERFSDIMKPKFSNIIRENWKFCNPIHCIDLIRFFGGEILEINSNPDSKRFLFSAMGTLTNNVKFNYISNWNSPGSWSVTLYANKIRISFNPLEKGIINDNGKKFEIVPDKQDISFKPGFSKQLEYFIEYFVKQRKPARKMCDLEDHKKTLELIEKIYGI